MTIISVPFLLFFLMFILHLTYIYSWVYGSVMYFEDDIIESARGYELLSMSNRATDEEMELALLADVEILDSNV